VAGFSTGIMRDFQPVLTRTKGVVNARLIAQGIYTAFPSDPIVPLVIKTEDSRRLEDAIHAVLVYAGKQITNIRGTEWFRTNAR
jgi:hypothetical protein